MKQEEGGRTVQRSIKAPDKAATKLKKTGKEKTSNISIEGRNQT